MKIFNLPRKAYSSKSLTYATWLFKRFDFLEKSDYRSNGGIIGKNWQQESQALANSSEYRLYILDESLAARV